jgi:predicted kinase
MLIGNIGSGKTTLAKNFVNQGYIAVSRDWLRYAIREGDYLYDPDLEPIIFRTEWYLFENLIQLGYDIVLDEVNVSKLLRCKYIHLAKEFGYEVIAYVMPKLTQAESVKRRLQNNHGNTNKTTWKKVWSDFNKHYEAPTKKEGFDKITQWFEAARIQNVLRMIDKVRNEKD